MKAIGITVASIVLLAGCASSGIVSIDKDTFAISKTSAAGVFGNNAGVKNDINEEANLLCAKQNKSAYTINVKDVPSSPGRLGSASLTFRCVTSGPKQSEQCFGSLVNDPELAAIKDKVSLWKIGDQSFSMVSDNSLPTAKEREILKLWGSKRDTCLRLDRREQQEFGRPSQLLSKDISYQSAAQLLIVDLMNGKMTYSGYAAKRQELATTAANSEDVFRADVRKESQESNYKADKLNLEAQRNDAMREKIASDERIQNERTRSESMKNSGYSNPITTTNCRRDGLGGVSCTTQ